MRHGGAEASHTRLFDTMLTQTFRLPGCSPLGMSKYYIVVEAAVSKRSGPIE